MKKLITTLIVGLSLMISGIANGNGHGNDWDNDHILPLPCNSYNFGNFENFCRPSSVPEPGSTTPLLSVAAIAVLSKRKRQTV